jgi:pimeloyl-ACP methyl ester carboxylesterase
VSPRLFTFGIGDIRILFLPPFLQQTTSTVRQQRSTDGTVGSLRHAFAFISFVILHSPLSRSDDLRSIKTISTFLSAINNFATSKLASIGYLHPSKSVGSAIIIITHHFRITHVGMACGNPKDSIFIQYLLIISIMIMTTQLKLASSFHSVARRPLVSLLSSKRFGQASTFSSASGSAGGSRYRKKPTSVCQMTIADTPLGTDEGAKLLDGLDVYTVPAKGDQHPLTVYGIHSSEPSPDDNILLLLHGRTWSSVPVYHLLGGPANEKKGKESRSLMEGLHRRKIQPYTMDFRGFGGTPHDEENCVTPNRCVEDVETVLQWIVERHGLPEDKLLPALLGWSQGALVAQLVAQKPHPSMSKVIFYGSIYDPMVRYPREPLYIQNRINTTNVENTWDGAIEDFTIEGTIPPEAAQEFADAALVSDPIKCQWKQLHQFNNCDPGRVHVPTLVVSLSSRQSVFENAVPCDCLVSYVISLYELHFLLVLLLDCWRSRSVCAIACTTGTLLQS